MNAYNIRPVSYRSIDLQSEDQKNRYWNAFERMRGQWYTAAQVHVIKRFDTEAGVVARQVLNAGTEPLAVMDQAINTQKPEWEQLLQSVYISVGETFAPHVIETLNPGGKSYRFGAPAKKLAGGEIWRAFVMNYIRRQSATKITQITDTTREVIKLALMEGIHERETPKQMANRVMDAYSEMTPYRAEMITRTEIINASNAASVAGAKASGAAVQKVWLAARDKRTREDHREADGQAVGLDEPFSVGGYQLMWPGDSSLGAPGQRGNQLPLRGHIQKTGMIWREIALLGRYR